MKVEDRISTRQPTVILPYTGPDVSGASTDIFLYLRPESNGVNVEKCIFRVLHNVPAYKNKVKMVYLSNLPGDFLQEHGVVRQHYAVREYFARNGKKGMTSGMRSHFKVYFGKNWEDARILGSYEALEALNLDPEELFDLWVPPYDILITCGQMIKRKDGIFIINYDIPSLLGKNNANTDIAAMVLRFSLCPEEIHTCLEEIRQSLVLDGILDPMKPPARVFHFSKSPFDLILDSMGHLVDKNGKLAGWEETSFGRFLLEHGMTAAEVERLIRNPIVQFQLPGAAIIEENIHVATIDFTYQEAWDKWQTRVGHILLEEK